MMREVSQEVHRAAFAYSLISALKAWKVAPERPEFSANSVDGGLNKATIEEWHAGNPPEVVARKVVTGTSSVYWLRADLADTACLRIAQAEEEVQRILADVIGWSAAMDEANAARRGMTVEDYRRERNAQGHRQVMRSGRNSIGMS